MFDANKILGMLMDSGMSRSGQSRAQRVAAHRDQSPAGSGGQSSGGGLAGMARSMLGGGDQSRESRQSAGGSGGGLAGLAGSLFGGGGRTGSARSGGAMAMLGALASMAMQHFGSGQGAARAGSGQPGGQRAAQPGLAEAPTPYAAGAAGAGAVADDDTRATVMIRAMIAAAKADGEISAEEKQRILGRLEEAGADPEEQAFVRDEMAKPTDVNAIVSAVDSPQTAVEAYAASLFAIDVDTPAETAHMQKLAQGLRLDPALVRQLHESLEAPPPR